MLASALALLSTAALPLRAQSRPVLRLLTHDSFELPPELLKRFEAEAGVQLQIVKGGDAGEMLNRLILTRRKPLADLVFGIDNALLPRALDAGVLDAYDGPAARRPAVAPLEGGVVPVDFGFVALNIDRAWFASRNRALPTSLQELATPAWRNLLVVQNPATSSPGQAFLQATIAGLGEEAAFDWWARMRANGVKVVRGWTEAYYTEFTRNGGTRPIVVSYAGSPAAEVFFADKPLETSPTASLFLSGGVFRQVEGVALVKGGNPAVREAAGRFIEFLRSAPVQQALQTSMWMYPAEAEAPLVDVMRRHAPRPDRFDNPPPAQALARARAWQERWTRVVLK
ncbi:MAG: thiamine ABC transporter substrate-binding protein [Hydrogenophaga sp.]|nr:thiamine ABC transporter substrate-binding protein [Hydrogenophaga sp.]MBS4038479.1 thiamine ABC transporter substrate-binding protein [Hydrogenophaga sp.]